MDACAENGYVSTVNSHTEAVLQRAIAIIHTNAYCTLATVSADGTPWGSPLFFAVDEALNLYWSSAVAALHSRNIAQSDGTATITIFNPVVHAGVTEGVYFSGQAKMISETHAIESAIQLMMAKSGKSLQRTAADYQDSSSRRIYQFEVEQAWITGDRLADGNQLIDTKIELDVCELRSRFASIVPPLR